MQIDNHSNTYAGVDKNGERIYESNDELLMAEATYVFKQWIKNMKVMCPNITLKQFHDSMTENKEKFDYLKKNICWSDSFMIDNVNFKIGGGRRLIKIPELYQPVMIEGIPHIITNFGLLTFDAAPEKYDDDSDGEIDIYDKAEAGEMSG